MVLVALDWCNHLRLDYSMESQLSLAMLDWKNRQWLKCHESVLADATEITESNPSFRPNVWCANFGCCHQLWIASFTSQPY